VLAGLCVAPCLADDVLVLEGGRRIEVEQWWRDGDRLMYRKYGGTVGIPSDTVLEILDGDDGSDRLLSPPRTHGYPQAQDAPAAASPTSPPGSPPPASWERDLYELESRLRREPGARAEVEPRMAMLWTQAGNRRYRQQDVAGALEAYETALGLDPSLVEARLNLASAYLSAGRAQQALREADQVLATSPQEVDALILRGEALYRVERLDPAIEAWTRAHEIAPSPRTEQRLEKASRERAVGGEFVRSDAAHFTLVYDGAVTDAPVGRDVLAFLEQQFNGLVQRYNHLPPSVIVVILYPAREFHDVTGTPSWTGGIFDGKIRVPIGGLHGMTAALQRTLVHELTHSFVASKSQGGASRWMQEGLAQLEEGKRPDRGTLLALARTYRSDGSRWGQGLDYPSSLALADFLISRYGFSSVLQVLEHEARGLSEDQALRKVLGISTNQLLAAWGEALVDGEIR
jgi:tetratricopeptide (TPR) repeat protein